MPNILILGSVAAVEGHGRCLITQIFFYKCGMMNKLVENSLFGQVIFNDGFSKSQQLICGSPV